MDKRFDLRLIISMVLELLGVAGIVWGCALIAPFLGFIVGGIGLVLVGLSVDPPKRGPKIIMEAPE